MKKRHALMIATLVVGITAGSIATAAPHPRPMWENFYDYFTVNMHNFPAQGKILSLSSNGGVTAVQQRPCNNGQCYFYIHGLGHGDQGNVTVTIGTDASHNCTFYLTDGAWVSNAEETSPPSCVGGYTGSTQLTHTSGTYQYSFDVNAPA